MTYVSARQPVFLAPRVIVVLLGVLGLIHAGRAMLSPDADGWLLISLAFIPARYGPEASSIPGEAWSGLLSPFTHMLLHGDIVHLIMNGAWLLAFGTAIARRMGAVRFLVFGTLAGLSGALAFYLVNPNVPVPVVGISGAVSGLMGGVFRFLFNARDHGGFERLRLAPRSIPLMSLAEAVGDRQVMTAVGIWVGLNLLFATGLSQLLTEGQIAWEAHLGGFALGFLAMGLFDPPRADRGPVSGPAF